MLLRVLTIGFLVSLAILSVGMAVSGVTPWSRVGSSAPEIRRALP